MADELGLLVEFKAKYDQVENSFKKISDGNNNLLKQNNEVERSFNSVAQNLKSGFTNAAAALAILGTALAVTSTGIFAFVSKTDEGIDKITDMARGLGVAASDLQKLGYAASLGGVSIDGVGDSLKRFNINVGKALSGNKEAIESFRQLGLGVEDLRGKDLTSQFLLTATAASKLKDNNIAAAASSELFGRNYTQALSLGRDGISENVKGFEALGVTLTDAQRQASDAFGDAKIKLSTIWDGFLQKISANVSPALTGLTNQITDFIQASGGIDAVSTNVSNKLIAIINTSAEVFKSISSNVGVLIDKVSFLLEKSKALINNTLNEDGIGADILNRFALVRDVLANGLSGNGFTVDPTIVGNPVNQAAIVNSRFQAKQNQTPDAISVIPNFRELATSTQKTTTSLDKLSETFQKTSDNLISTGLATNKGTTDRLAKVFDIINQRDPTNTGRPEAPSSDFEQWSADLIQSLQNGDIASGEGFNMQLSNLQRLKMANEANGFNTGGQQGVIDEIKKYADTLGIKPQQIEIALTIGASGDFVAKMAQSSAVKVVIHNEVSDMVANAAHLGAHT